MIEVPSSTRHSADYGWTRCRHPQKSTIWDPLTGQLIWQLEVPNPSKMDSNSKTPSSECTGTDATLDNENSTVFSASTTRPFAANSDMYHINHQFDDMNFDEVQVEGINLKVCTEPVGKERQHAILMLCAGI